MFVRVLKESRCTFSYWYDRNWGDRWKDDAWEARERPESLKAGQVFKAERIRPSAKLAARADIEIVFMAEMSNSYVGVPYDCIEIVEAVQEPVASS